MIRIDHPAFAHRNPARRNLARIRVISRLAHRVLPSSLARISAICTGSTPVFCQCSAPTMCIRQELSPARHRLRARIQHPAHLVLQHRTGHIRVLDRKRPAKPAALLKVLNLHQLHPAHRAQQLQGPVAQMQTAQPMAARMVRHTVRIMCAHILQPKLLRQELRKLPGIPAAAARCGHFGLQRLVLQPLRHQRIVIAHHRHATGRRAHHRLRRFELLHKSPQQRIRLFLVAGIPVHLPAAGLAGRKVDSMSQPLQHADHGLTRLRKQRVVIAGDEQPETRNPLPLRSTSTMRAHTAQLHNSLSTLVQ